MFPELAFLNNLRRTESKLDKLQELETEIPPKLIPFMQSRKMYQVLYGGRSSAKSRTFVAKLLKRALEKPNQTILCTREFQSSIATSTYAELKQVIYEKNLNSLFSVKHDHISCHNGTQFIFKGLARDIMQIKSIPNIDICVVEEAETIKRELWDVLNPTLRKEGSELIVVFNPKERDSATYQMWVVEPIPDDDILRIEINYHDNPYNSPTILKKIEWMKEHDYSRYEHIYLGKLLDISEDVIFKGKFKILDVGLEKRERGYFYQGKQVAMLYGMDFGFSVDPAALIEMCFLDENTIYINNEIYKTGLLPQNRENAEYDYMNSIQRTFGSFGLRGQWFADSARPDTIAQLKQLGLKVEGAPKLKNSIESGIEYLLGKNIIVNPRCTNMIFECYNYKYKRDKNSGTILSEIIDSHNHCWDSVRYGLCKQIAASLRKQVRVDPNVMRQLGI